jgi:hypothetical protein
VCVVVDEVDVVLVPVIDVPEVSVDIAPVADVSVDIAPVAEVSVDIVSVDIVSVEMVSVVDIVSLEDELIAVSVPASMFVSSFLHAAKTTSARAAR